MVKGRRVTLVTFVVLSCCFVFCRRPGFYHDGGHAVVLRLALLPAEGLRRPRTAVWFYRQSILPALAAGPSNHY